MRDTALELGLGTRLALIPELADPKDLYRLVRPALRSVDAVASVACVTAQAVAA
jgi:hypothetical protein